MKIFAMSDIHGCLDEFLDALNYVNLNDKNNVLVLCGDYIHGGCDSYGVVEKIIELKKKYKDRVIVLAGNHECDMLEQGYPIVDSYSKYEEFDQEREDKCHDFLLRLKYYYKYKNEVLFCHAGVNEEAGEDWEVGTPAFWYIGKYPPTIGNL